MDLFCNNAQNIMIEQYKSLKTHLGINYFLKNKNKQLSSAKAFCFLKKMSVKEFISYEPS